MSTFVNDIALMQAFHDGKREAENFIFQKFFRPMCLVGYNITGSLPVAEDIVAEAFIKLFDRRTEFAGLENISALLYVSVRNASLTHNTTQNRHRAAHQQIAATAMETAANHPDALQLEIMEAELVHSIYREMENLPGKCRDIFKMIFLRGMSTEQIAAQLTISPQTVRTQKARAIQLLKAGLLKKIPLLLISLLKIPLLLTLQAAIAATCL